SACSTISACIPSPPRTPSPTTHPLSLHDALPIYEGAGLGHERQFAHVALLLLDVLHRLGGRLLVVDHQAHGGAQRGSIGQPARTDRKSTRLNSSHVKISYAVFCLKKKKRITYPTT